MFTGLTILGGSDKCGSPEPVREITINKGQIYSIVGFTGSGKSQLISDIEQMAQGDTISKRRILFDGQRPDPQFRYNPERKLVAHLSQNMNFVIDMQVGEFLKLHTKCRGFANYAIKASEILACANIFAGEPIKPTDALTRLSGGQSRSLMIANVAINNTSPVILIDEIENAGIDKVTALKTLTEHGKIVLLVTHDPVLALYGTKRIVMQNGGMQKVINLTEEERIICATLKEMSDIFTDIQAALRLGQSLKLEAIKKKTLQGGACSA